MLPLVAVIYVMKCTNNVETSNNARGFLRCFEISFSKSVTDKT